MNAVKKILKKNSERWRRVNTKKGTIVYGVSFLMCAFIIMLMGIEFYYGIDTSYIMTRTMILLLAWSIYAIIVAPQLHITNTFNEFIQRRSDLSREWIGNKFQPRVYYRIDRDHNTREFFVCDNGSKAAEVLIDSMEYFAKALNTVVLDKQVDRNGVTIIMERKMRPQEKMTMASVEPAGVDTIRISNNFEWNYKKHPNGLIVGRVGSGKTALSFAIMKQLKMMNAVVYFCDPKNSEVSRGMAESVGAQYFSTAEDIVCILSEMRNTILSRSRDLESLPEELRDEIREKDFRSVICVIDELAALPAIPEIDKKTYGKVLDSIRAICLLGREANVSLICLAQRADASIFGDGAVRTQFSFRCAMGKMADKDGYNMVFPGCEEVVLTRHEKGAGLAMLLSDERPREIVVPWYEGIDGYAEAKAEAEAGA